MGERKSAKMIIHPVTWQIYGYLASHRTQVYTFNSSAQPTLQQFRDTEVVTRMDGMEEDLFASKIEWVSLKLMQRHMMHILQAIEWGAWHDDPMCFSGWRHAGWSPEEVDKWLHDNWYDDEPWKDEKFKDNWSLQWENFWFDYKMSEITSMYGDFRRYRISYFTDCWLNLPWKTSSRWERPTNS